MRKNRGFTLIELLDRGAPHRMIRSLPEAVGEAGTVAAVAATLVRGRLPAGAGVVIAVPTGAHESAPRTTSRTDSGSLLPLRSCSVCATYQTNDKKPDRAVEWATKTASSPARTSAGGGLRAHPRGGPSQRSGHRPRTQAAVPPPGPGVAWCRGRGRQGLRGTRGLGRDYRGHDADGPARSAGRRHPREPGYLRGGHRPALDPATRPRDGGRVVEKTGRLVVAQEQWHDRRLPAHRRSAA